MTNLKSLAVAVPVLLAACLAQGQFSTNSSSTSVNSLIPDGNPSGMTSTATFSGISGSISSVSVNLNITGGFNGDLYAYLVGPASSGPTSDFAILLNRSGIGSTSQNGYSDPGFNITLSDGSPNIHDYQADSPTLNGSGQLTGTWGPDGRNIDPQSSPGTFDTANTGTDFSTFSGTANGDWTLFIADMSSGGQATLVSWGLTVVTVPEPETWALLIGGVGVLFALNRRRKL